MKRQLLIFIFIFINTLLFPKVWKNAEAEVSYSTINTVVGQVIEFSIRFDFTNDMFFSSIVTNTNSEEFNIHFDDNNSFYTNKSAKTIRLIKKGKIQIFEIDDFSFRGFNITVTNKKRKLEFKNIGQCRIFVTPPMIDSKKKPPILDIKGPMSRPSSFPYWLFFIIAIIIIVLIYLLKKKKAVYGLPGLGDDEDLWVTIEKRMSAIKSMNTGDDEALKEYFIAITDTIKIFLTGRSGIHFLEFTTVEVSQNTLEIQWLMDDQSKSLMRFFTYADMVKFAKEVPGESDITGYYENVYDWLKSVNSQYIEIQKAFESEDKTEDNPE